jgi:cytochrome b
VARSSRKARQSRKSAPPTLPPAPARFRVWDLPTRLSHGLITLLFLVLMLGGQYGYGPGWLHLWAGYLLLIVVLWRIGWGLVGSDSARFSRILPGPRALINYLPVLFSRQRSDHAGHNPVGALSTMLLLALLLIQCITGLFYESWGELRGPLAERVSRGTVLLMNDLHDLLRWPLYLVISIHVLAVLAYLVFKREDRIRPMFSHGQLPAASDPKLAQRGPYRALVVLLICALPVLMIAWLGPIA